MVSDAQEHMMAQNAEIEKLRLQLAETTAAARETAANAQANIQVILGEERQKSQAERQALIAQISNLINATGEEQDRRLTERVEAVRTEVGATQSKIDEATAAHESGLETWKSREGEFYSRLCSAKETVREVLENDWKVSFVWVHTRCYADPIIECAASQQHDPEDEQVHPRTNREAG